jgi:chemotaxis-related protein WspB
LPALFVQLQIGVDGYAVPARRVVRILPRLAIHRLPGATAPIVGTLQHESRLIPTMDLSLLALGQAAAWRLSTRILLVNPFPSEDDVRLLGVIAEGVTDTIALDDSQFASAGVRGEGASYLGPVALLDGRPLQRIEVHRLLPERTLAALYDAFEGNA